MKYFLSLIFFILFFSVAPAQQRLIRKADKALKKEQLSKARRKIDRATTNRKTKNDPQAWLLKGHIYSNLALDTTEAEHEEALILEAAQAYRAADSLSQPESLSGLYARQSLEKLYHQVIDKAIRLTDSGNYKKTITQLDLAKMILPQQAETYIYAGQLALAQKNYERAKQNFNYLIDELHYREEGLSEILDNLINIQLIQQAPLDSTLSYLHKAQQLVPDSIDFIEREIAILINAGKLNQAADKLEEKELPEESMASLYEELAEAFSRQDDLIKAINYHQKALEFRPQDTHLLLALAKSHQQIATNMITQQTESPDDEVRHHMKAASDYLQKAREVSGNDPLSKANIQLMERELEALKHDSVQF